MRVVDFIAKWWSADLSECAAAHSHFRDMCDLLGEEASTDVDPKGARYAFKKGATKTTGGEGWPTAAAALERLRESPGGSRPHENVDGRIKSDQIRP